MKHKVSKKMYTIKVDGKIIRITEDHSVMVLRNGVLLSIKPDNILNSDKLITIEGKI
jgi:intein/homing endonuclease